MSTWDEPKIIREWNQLCDIAFELRDQPGWVFRGVSSSQYELIPKIGRRDMRQALDGKELPYMRCREITLIQEFKRQAVPFVRIESHSTAEVLAVAQHHGLPTRLLDWTESFLTAAFFAVDHAGAGRSEKDPHACIYALRGVPDLDGDDPLAVPQDEVRLYRPAHAAVRIASQRGLFTVHGSPDKAFDPPSEAENNGMEARRWLIDRDRAFMMKRALDVAGINQASVFPDLDGLARYLAWKYKRDRLPRDEGWQAEG